MIEQYPFYIEVTYGYYDKGNYIEKQEAVIIPAESFEQAVGKIEKNYGSELIKISWVECLNCCEDIVLDIESGRSLLRNHYRYNNPAPEKEILSIEVITNKEEL